MRLTVASQLSRARLSVATPLSIHAHLCASSQRSPSPRCSPLPRIQLSPNTVAEEEAVTLVADSAGATAADSAEAVTQAAAAAAAVAHRRLMELTAGRLQAMLQAIQAKLQAMLPAAQATAAQQIPPRIRPRPPASSAAARGRLLRAMRCAAAPSPPLISSRPTKPLHPTRAS